MINYINTEIKKGVSFSARKNRLHPENSIFFEQDRILVHQVHTHHTRKKQMSSSFEKQNGRIVFSIK